MFHCAVPATGAHASKAVPLSHGSTPVTGSRASSAAPVSHGTEARASSTAPFSHVARSTKAVAPACRTFQWGCLPSARSGYAVAIGFRCEIPVTETPRSLLALDSTFPRNGGGRSTLFPVREEAASLNASSTSSRRYTVKKPSPVGIVLMCSHPPKTRFRSGLLGVKALFRLAHATPHAQRSFISSGTGQTDTARRASGNSTTSDQINWVAHR